MTKTERKEWITRTVQIPGHETCIASQALNEAMIGFDRYEYLRTLNPQQFADVCRISMTESVPFDLLVDNAMRVIEKRGK